MLLRAMNKSGSPPPGKGPRWIVDQIAAAFASSGGGATREAPPAPVDIGELVKQTLQEELGRLEGEKDGKDFKDSKDNSSEP